MTSASVTAGTSVLRHGDLNDLSRTVVERASNRSRIVIVTTAWRRTYKNLLYTKYRPIATWVIWFCGGRLHGPMDSIYWHLIDTSTWRPSGRRGCYVCGERSSAPLVDAIWWWTSNEPLQQTTWGLVSSDTRNRGGLLYIGGARSIGNIASHFRLLLFSRIVRLCYTGSSVQYYPNLPVSFPNSPTYSELTITSRLRIFIPRKERKGEKNVNRQQHGDFFLSVYVAQRTSRKIINTLSNDKYTTLLIPIIGVFAAVFFQY